MSSDDLTQLFTRLGVLRHGHFQLSSGRHSDTYLQCAQALQWPDVALQLGRALADRLGTGRGAVDVVASPALGGVLAGFVTAAALGCRFAFTERDPQGVMRLRRGQRIDAGERVAVVEDVVTTGGSAMETARLCEAAGGRVVALAAIVDRSAGLPESQRPALPVTALLPVAPSAWSPAECPLCRDGVALDRPGSKADPAARAPQ